jgi:D-amino-acid dehydrogenase
VWLNRPQSQQDPSGQGHSVTVDEAPAGRASGKPDVAIIGAGAVGASIALELTRLGRSVAVLDMGSGWAPACSSRNAGYVCPSHAEHFATRQDIANAVRWLLRPDSPFGIQPRPALVPFAFRLLRGTRRSACAHAASVLRDLASRSLDQHVELHASGLDTGLVRDGLLDVYATQRAFRKAQALLRERASLDSEPTVLSARELAALEPGIAVGRAGGILHAGDAHCDPLRYVEAVGGAALAAGATFRPGVRVERLRAQGSGVSIETSSGPLAAGTVVVAAGAWTKPLLRRAGWRLPLEPGAGYSIDLGPEAAGIVRRPTLLREERVALTPLSGRLRLAGTLEFRGLDSSPSPARLNGILDASTRAFPALRHATVRSTWGGLRPCTPDGLPVVGWLSTTPPIAVAAGHAMLGLTLAPVTATLIGDLLDGRANALLPALRPQRFAAIRRGHAVA